MNLTNCKRVILDSNQAKNIHLLDELKPMDAFSKPSLVVDGGNASSTFSTLFDFNAGDAFTASTDNILLLVFQE